MAGWFNFLSTHFTTNVHFSVTAAGIALDKPFVEQSWKEVRRVQDVNVSRNSLAGSPGSNANNTQGDWYIFRRPTRHQANATTRDWWKLGPGGISVRTCRHPRPSAVGLSCLQRSSQDAQYSPQCGASAARDQE